MGLVVLLQDLLHQGSSSGLSLSLLVLLDPPLPGLLPVLPGEHASLLMVLLRQNLLPVLLSDDAEDVQEGLELLLADAVVRPLEVPGQLGVNEAPERPHLAAGFQVEVPGVPLLDVQPLEHHQVLRHLVGLPNARLLGHIRQKGDGVARNLERIVLETCLKEVLYEGLAHLG